MVIDKQLQKEIRSGNLITFNFVNIGNVQESKEVNLIICIAFFCSKFMQCLELADSNPMRYKHMKDGGKNSSMVN